MPWSCRDMTTERRLSEREEKHGAKTEGRAILLKRVSALGTLGIGSQHPVPGALL